MKTTPITFSFDNQLSFEMFDNYLISNVNNSDKLDNNSKRERTLIVE